MVSPIVAQEMTDPKSQDEELGNVQWYRNYDDAVKVAKKTNKDIVILFQEVPGCATCRDYGHEVLTNPLMVEALENAFVPLAIFNNKQGHDREILNIFNEPTWNNPVVRIIDADGTNLTKRISGDYSALTLVKRMKEVLKKQGDDVPGYIDLLEQELSASSSSNIEEDVFSMYCFWSGEKNLGKLDGVLNVESGFMQGREVVKVKYDSDVVSEKELVNFGKKNDYTLRTVSNDYRVASNDYHYYLKNSIYKYIPMSDIQKTKVNSALGSSKNANQYLSPKQIEWLTYVSKNKKGFNSQLTEDIQTAWEVMEVKYEEMSAKK